MRLLINIFIIVLSISTLANAKLPPLSQEELEADSNVVIKGRIYAVKPTGLTDNNDCRDKTQYRASLAVHKYVRVTADWKDRNKAVFIDYWKYNYKEGCVGPSDHVHHDGEEGTYYLSCKTAWDCRLTHWNGFISK